MQNHNHIHFIGIGGIGISSLATLALSLKKTVSGSDITDSELIRDLKRAGARIFIGHRGEHVQLSIDLVIYTEAIETASNPELLRAQELGIPCLTYFEALGGISENHKTIAIAGTHGKTTTTVMLGRALIEDGFDPLVIAGTKVPDFGNRNIYIGKGEHFVVEACEYRRSFLSLRLHGLVLLNCEPDHMDYYRDEEDYWSAFCELAQKVPRGGFIVANADDPNLQRVLKAVQPNVIWVRTEDLQKTPVKPQVPGEFNRMNALAALRAAEAIGADAETVLKSLNSFKGAWRRMEIKGEWKGTTVIDDYGHHPTEIRATLRAMRERYPKRRLICVFQPHQYSRTRQLLAGFQAAFNDASVVIVPNIYEARDTLEDKKSISAEAFVKALQERHHHAVFGNGFENTIQILAKEAQQGDVIVLMGAGDVTEMWKMMTG